MKNLIVANFPAVGGKQVEVLERLIDAQIENSLELGWKAEDLVLCTNGEPDLRVKSFVLPMNERCLTGSKMFAVESLFEMGVIQEGDIWWVHDLDAWQNYWFEAPEFRDIGLAEYNIPKFNGGSIFLRHGARDLIADVVNLIRQERLDREEPAINRVLRKRKNADRVSIIDSTFNVGCSAYAIRLKRCTKPVLVSHFHPEGKSGWRTHVDGVNALGESSVSPRVKRLLSEKFRSAEARSTETFAD